MDISKTRSRSTIATITDPKILVPAIGGAFRKLDPRILIRNPVSAQPSCALPMTLALTCRAAATHSRPSASARK